MALLRVFFLVCGNNKTIFILDNNVLFFPFRGKQLVLVKNIYLTDDASRAHSFWWWPSFAILLLISKLKWADLFMRWPPFAADARFLSCSIIAACTGQRGVAHVARVSGTCLPYSLLQKLQRLYGFIGRLLCLNYIVTRLFVCLFFFTLVLHSS